MKRLNYIAACLVFFAPFVHAEKLGDILVNNTEAINNAQKMLESGKQFKTGELTNLLVNRLGVTPQQAAGGAGALLQIAKTRMNPDEFSKLSTQVPDRKSVV